MTQDETQDAKRKELKIKLAKLVLAKLLQSAKATKQATEASVTVSASNKTKDKTEL